MTRTFLTLFLTFGTLVLVAQTKEDNLQKLMEAYWQLNKLNGSVLVTQNGKVLLDRGYGFRDISESLKNEAATIFQIGSSTKQFTASVILKLQEMKKLNVQDKINKYFPGFPHGDSITIEHLLTHTSGIFNYTDDWAFMQTKATKPITQKELIALFTEKPLTFTPGTKWAYSNSNYVLLGYIIQQVSKKSYEQVVRELIFKPLNMYSTGFDYSGLKNQHKSKGYKMISENGGEESMEFDSTVSFAAGGMYSSTADLYKWQKGMSSYQVLKKTSLDRAITPYKNKYGYGIYIDSIYGKRIIAHGGLTFGFTSYLGRIPEDDISIIILNNTVNLSIGQIAKDVVAILYDQPYKVPEAEKEMTISAEVLRRYTGTYELAPQFSITFYVENGSLLAEATGQPKVRLAAQNEDKFFLKGTDTRVEFKKGESGNITGLVLMEGNRATPGKKVK